MRSFFESRIAFAATVLAFAMAMGLNAYYHSATAAGRTPNLPATLLSIIPTFPPCPTCPPPDGMPPDGGLMAAAKIIPTFPPCPTCPPPDGMPPDGGLARACVA